MLSKVRCSHANTHAHARSALGFSVGASHPLRSVTQAPPPAMCHTKCCRSIIREKDNLRGAKTSVFVFLHPLASMITSILDPRFISYVLERVPSPKYNFYIVYSFAAAAAAAAAGVADSIVNLPRERSLVRLLLSSPTTSVSFV